MDDRLNNPIPLENFNHLIRLLATTVSGFLSLRILLTPVRAREAKLRNLATLTQPGLSEERLALLSRLPDLVLPVWMVLRQHGAVGPSGRGCKPMSLTALSSKLSQGRSGLGPDAAVEHIDELHKILPDWLQRVDWAKPHFFLADADRPVKDVIKFVKDYILKHGLSV
ncbi:unnamed protein product [Protopolystoma xenopodis]|uniref:DNA replication factor Cdt1 C-terminal domain-containing protein n=1 Tax=Protopolystoma xenopodis TaxID=117903 RepID=A0A448WBV8_9PLAT|nr:unnamed protein product [Protopolystoma xenopodis]